mmetsp:Transcript_37764/g.70454  ORF Transcript_37764/g.70454 Transcript_37764/m.70454 type:complete len:203 (+) Transcript_37764:87-695(+)
MQLDMFRIVTFSLICGSLCVRDVLDDGGEVAARRSLEALAVEARRSRHERQVPDRPSSLMEDVEVHVLSTSPKADSIEDPEDEDEDEDEDDDVDRDQDAFAGTVEDGAQIEGAVEEFHNATEDAENKAHLVDENFAKYNGRLGELQDQLRRLSAMARSYHMQTIKWFKNAEQDKYSPIANMPLDTFKISKSKDDFPLESVSS